MEPIGQPPIELLAALEVPARSTHRPLKTGEGSLIPLQILTQTQKEASILCVELPPQHLDDLSANETMTASEGGFGTALGQQSIHPTDYRAVHVCLYFAETQAALARFS